MKKAFLQLHTSVFLAGFTGVLGRLITLNEGLLVWWRLLLTAATMWVLFLITKQIQKVSVRHIWQLSGIGLMAALHWVTFYGSIKAANVSVALVCFSAVGFFTSITEPLLEKKPIDFKEVILGVLVIAGISIIFHFDGRYKTGIILGVLCALFLAFVMVLLRRFLKIYNSATVLTYQLTGGFLWLSLLLPLYLFYFPVTTILPGWQNLGWLLFLSWVCSVLAFMLTGNALKKLSAYTVNLSFNLEPLYGILLAFLLYNEQLELGFSFYAGASLILLSVVLHSIIVWRRAKHYKS
ncbi:MAG: DMT family transporter [Chitinophagaceae bacterium]|nr:DMT family transporter [Chitinophagaceae bacterium]